MATMDRTLKELLNSVDGAKATAVAGFDGIAVASSQTDPNFSIDGVASSIAQALSSSMRAMDDCPNKPGPVGEMMITTDKSRVVIYPLNENYWACVVLATTGNLGKARLEMKKAVPSLMQEVV